MATTDNLATKGVNATPQVRAALNFTDTINEAINLAQSDKYVRLRDIMASTARIESAPSSLKTTPKQSLTHTLEEQVLMLDRMKGMLEDFDFRVDKVVDGGHEVVLFGKSTGKGKHSGNEFRDDRVILVRTSGEGNEDLTTKDAQGGDEARAGLPRIVYVLEFVDSANLFGFIAAEQAAAGVKEDA